MTPTDYAVNLRRRLAEANVNNLSCNAIAYKAGVSHHAVISMYTDGTTNPDYETVYQVAVALECSPIWLLTGDSTPDCKKDFAAYKKHIKTFWRRLLTVSARKQLGVQDFAEKLGVSKSSVSRWFNNSKTPCMESLLLIEEQFGYSPAYVLFARKPA